MPYLHLLKSQDTLASINEEYTVTLNEGLERSKKTSVQIMTLLLWLNFWPLYQPAQAAVIKITHTRWLKNRYFFYHNSGCWKSKIKVLAGLLSLEASLLGLQMATVSLGPHMAFHLCPHPQCLFCVYTFPLLIWIPARMD